MGTAFIMHGWMKIQTPFSWVPPTAPMHIPPFFQFLASVAEFGGGVTLVLGFLIPLSSFGLISTMAVAVYTTIVTFNAPLVNNSGGPSFELPLTYLLLAVMFLISGPGKFSLDRIIFGERKRSTIVQQ
jgi:putative oxidoreductase